MGKDGGGGGSPVHPQCALLNGPILRRRGEDLWRDTGPQTIALIVTPWHQAKYHIKRILEIINDIKLVDLTLQSLV